MFGGEFNAAAAPAEVKYRIPGVYSWNVRCVETKSILPLPDRGGDILLYGNTPRLH